MNIIGFNKCILIFISKSLRLALVVYFFIIIDIAIALEVDDFNKPPKPLLDIRTRINKATEIKIYENK